jgi:hypothetical protein
MIKQDNESSNDFYSNLKIIYTTSFQNGWFLCVIFLIFLFN